MGVSSDGNSLVVTGAPSVEDEDETATDAAFFEGAVRRGGICSGEGPCNAQGDLALLGQHSQALELVGRVGVVRHPHVAGRDGAFGMQRRGAALAGTTHDSDLTAVAQRGQHLVALQCGVDHGGDTLRMELPNPFSHISSSRDDLISTEGRDQLLVGRGGVGDHPEPLGLRQLYDVAANRTGGAGDREGFARCQVQHVERPAGGEPVHRQRGRLGVKWEVWEAYRQVRANQGAPGVDGVTLDQFDKDLKDNLYKIWNRMSSGSYFPPPVKAVEIPKPHGGGTRTLGVPTIADRVAQTVVARRLEAKVEPIFHPDSYGYRPYRSALDAVAACRQRCWKSDWVIDLDIQKFLDALSHCTFR